MSQKRKELKKCMKRLDGLHKELQRRRTCKRLNNYMEQLKELQRELDKRQPQKFGHPVCESQMIPHPIKLHEYTISFCQLDNCGRELLEDALNARCNAYAPYSNCKVGAAFRSKNGRVFTGCNVESVAFTAGCCAERTALVKGVSEGCRVFNAGAVVAYHPSGYATPCGVCRQFIHEFAKMDIPIYIARAPEISEQLPAFEDDAEVLVTSIYHLLPHSFLVY
ncbi:cytidine deaminase [Drosophila grimshawi]|uniref:cytidine deaminase n=1 Tax=Drosophila grimshawi TaxID=7222 RepID=B4JB38_DROGR|nr:cytidine deaminase [Drosophila grimshawi]EDW03930.1 GH11515 [Drosophila grimshawi]